MTARLVAASKPIAAMLRGEIAVMAAAERERVLGEFISALGQAEAIAADPFPTCRTHTLHAATVAAVSASGRVCCPSA